MITINVERIFAGRIQGTVVGHPNFEDGSPILTSPIETSEVIGGALVATTRSGSHYRCEGISEGDLARELMEWNAYAQSIAA